MMRKRKHCKDVEQEFLGQKPQCGRRPQASPTLVSPVGQGATRGLETRGGGKQKGDGDEGAFRAVQGDVDWTERMHGGQPLLEGFMPRNAGVHGKKTQDAAEHRLQREAVSPV